jgi:glycosyltransferase involved in cell wall biosynthesis
VAGFVVGGVGSFRGFHALEQLVEAAACAPDTQLLLVGDGPERPRIEQMVRDRGVRATFTGTVSHADLPTALAAMDAGVLVAPPDGSFHYSPLKLAEYLAAGLPVVAPAVGQVVERLTDSVDALLVPAGDVRALAEALVLLRGDPALRRRLSVAGRQAAAREWSWDRQVRGVVERLDL